MEGIRKVASGDFAFGPEVAQRVGAKEHRASAAAPASSKPATKLHLLTPREQQILRMIGRGHSRVEIAKTIHRSPKTVDAHRASVMDKLGIHDRVELARYAIREGLVEA
jgi:DNA-binding NarL/FixJ family response regulator